MELHRADPGESWRAPGAAPIETRRGAFRRRCRAAASPSTPGYCFVSRSRDRGWAAGLVTARPEGCRPRGRLGALGGQRPPIAGGRPWAVKETSVMPYLGAWGFWEATWWSGRTTALHPPFSLPPGWSEMVPWPAVNSWPEVALPGVEGNVEEQYGVNWPLCLGPVL
ncbi:hypothetical protein NDU88_008346 [Pleurodeles waltl]|uniref:Uncharacterized protein n=1 Tax=Pleurodeles waltl TaxID=8319 RepID=A0AAV7PNW2_PLEWA|nr:hypothetical protein NDU88_008346 [Pleurodeles waltl]